MHGCFFYFFLELFWVWSSENLTVTVIQSVDCRTFSEHQKEPRREHDVMPACKIAPLTCSLLSSSPLFFFPLLSNLLLSSLFPSAPNTQRPLPHYKILNCMLYIISQFTLDINDTLSFKIYRNTYRMQITRTRSVKSCDPAVVEE